MAQKQYLQNLNRSNLYFTPLSDRWYYLGLAELGRHRPRPQWALVYFRRFLDQQSDGPWTRRTRHHIVDIGEQPLSDRIESSGAAAIDMKKVGAAIAAADNELQRCVEPVPNALLRVRVTALVKRRRSTGGRPSARSGVRTTIDYSFANKAEAIAAAIQCVNRVATTIKLPPAKGIAGQYVDLVFPLIAKP